MQGKSWKKPVILLLVIILSLFAGLGYWYFKQKNNTLKFKAEPVKKGSLSAQVIATGTVNPVTLVQVGSQVSGAIFKLYADFNSVVRKGQVIAQIDPALFKAKVDQTRADLQNSQANLEKEKAALEDNLRTLNRYKTLWKENLISQMDVDTAQTKYDQSLATIKSVTAQIATAKANLATAQTNLNYTTISSPVDGIVVSRNVDIGQTVAASLQAPTLFVIAQDLKDMEVHTNVDEADIGNVKVGQTAIFTVDAFPGESFTARVGQVRNAATTVQNVVTYDVVLKVKNPDLKLMPGMTANVSILVNQRENVLMVPNAALRFKPARKDKGAAPEAGPEKKRKGQGVWISGPDDKPVRVPVRTGISDGQYTEIISDKLKEGDPVITDMLEQKGAKPESGQGQQKRSPMSGMRF